MFEIEVIGVKKGGGEETIQFESLPAEAQNMIKANFKIKELVNCYLGHWFYERYEEDAIEFERNLSDMVNKIYAEISALSLITLELPIANRKWQSLVGDGAKLTGYQFVMPDGHCGHIDNFGKVTWS